MSRTSRGSRDSHGAWHPDNPDDYLPLATHGIWPWSTLDQTSAPWKARRAHWEALNIDDITPRAHAPAMITTGRHAHTSGGVSRFDPVLAELCTLWYSPPTAHMIDPCAGGPVRGIVAAMSGRTYHGIDLMDAQIDANHAMAARHNITTATWEQGDALDTLPHLPSEHADYALTCPPYWNRERYSDDPRDLSRMTWDAFLQAHATIIRETLRCLRPDSFATWVISDVRDHRGHLRGLPARTVQAFENAGAHLISEQVIIEPGGLRAKTTRPPWEACRTPTRRHQFALTFVKGNRREAARKVRAC